MYDRPQDVFDILAAGQAPELHRELKERNLFSQKLRDSARSLLNEDRIGVKIKDSPILLPSELEQFSEFIEIVAEAHIKKHGEAYYNACQGLMYVNQKRLSPGDFSRSGKIHIDVANVSDVLDGHIPNAEIYTSSDIADLTTRIYTHPFELSREFYAIANRRYGGDVIETTFNHDIEQQADPVRSVTPSPYQVVSYSATQPHQARTPVADEVTRTFAAIILHPIDEPYNEREYNGLMLNAEKYNAPLQRWMAENPPEFGMRFGEARLGLD